MRLAGRALACLLGIGALACAPDSGVTRWGLPRAPITLDREAGRPPEPSAPAASPGGTAGTPPGAMIDPLSPAAAAPAPDAAAPAPDPAPPPPGDDAGAPPLGGEPTDAPPSPGAESGDAGAGGEPADAPVDASDPCQPGGCKRVFVSSSAMPNGGFGSVSTADALCQRLATAAALGGMWRAWVSDERRPAASRLTPSPRPYRLLDGTQVAASWAALTSGTIDNPIDRHEDGAPVPGGGHEIWTGTTAAGGASGITCGNWTNNSPGLPNGHVGHTSRRDVGWTQALAQRCNQTAAHLYCFEQ